MIEDYMIVINWENPVSHQKQYISDEYPAHEEMLWNQQRFKFRFITDESVNLTWSTMPSHNTI